MKKIFKILLVLFSLVGLSSCIDLEVIDSKEHDVTFIIEYNDYSHTVIISDGEVVLEPDEPIREGFIFNGWFYNGAKYLFSTPVTKNIVIYGEWLINNGQVDDPKEQPNSINLDLYYINDLHGSLSKKEDQIGLDYMANVILSEQEDKDVLFIAGGDILQGQVESNHFKGESIIYTLNAMNLDAFVIGNHEFDWGLDTVLSYFNGENEIQANYPLLGANVFLKETNELPNGITPYTIVNKNGLDVLIIGVIGYGLESSIDGALVEDYYFADPTPIVRNYINELKDQVDVIVVAAHWDNDNFNNRVASYGTDVILNGHSHQKYIKTASRVPILQTGSSGRYLGKVEITHNKLHQITTVNAYNLSPQDDRRLYEAKEEITVIINYYLNQITHLLEPILISENYYSVNDLAFYIAKVMREKTNADVAFHNSGGTRASLSKGEEISESTILGIFPFDNFIITVDLKGSEINKFLNSSNGTIKDIRPGLVIKENETYKVAIHSYTFNFTSNPFMYGDNINHTNIVLREAIIEVLRSQKSKGYTYFNINNPITFDIELEAYIPKETNLFLS